jgi:hypothetical protein
MARGKRAGAESWLCLPHESAIQAGNSGSTSAATKSHARAPRAKPGRPRFQTSFANPLPAARQCAKVPHDRQELLAYAAFLPTRAVRSRPPPRDEDQRNYSGMCPSSLKSFRKRRLDLLGLLQPRASIRSRDAELGPTGSRTMSHAQRSERSGKDWNTRFSRPDTRSL